MTAIRKALLLLVAVFVAGAAGAQSEAEQQNDATPRTYSLHTLDYRVAETLVWEICDRNGGQSFSCRVRDAAPGGLDVYAPQKVHAQIVAMLSERDESVPSSLLFEIVLVRLIDNGKDKGGKLAPHQQRALDAIREILPAKRAEIFDTGLIRTTTGGRTQLADASGNAHEAILEVRSVVAGTDGLVFTIELRILHMGDPVLASTLTIAEGETVVAGSSRTGSDKAMVVLLTSKSQG